MSGFFFYFLKWWCDRKGSWNPPHSTRSSSSDSLTVCSCSLYCAGGLTHPLCLFQFSVWRPLGSDLGRSAIKQVFSLDLSFWQEAVTTSVYLPTSPLSLWDVLFRVLGYWSNYCSCSCCRTLRLQSSRSICWKRIFLFNNAEIKKSTRQETTAIPTVWGTATWCSCKASLVLVSFLL